MKKRTTYPLVSALISCLLCLMLSSCLKEDTDGCDREVPVAFILQSNPEEELFSGPETAAIYIFDTDGAFVDMETVERPAIGQEYLLEKKLAPGFYCFTVWINHRTEDYFISPDMAEERPRKSLAALYLNIPTDRVVDKAPGTLMFGAANNQEIVQSNRYQTIRIPIHQNTNRINLKVYGLERTGDSFLFDIADSNGIYDFDNNHVDCKTFNYRAYSAFTYGKDHLESSLTVLRLGEGQEPQLTFINNTSGRTLYPSYEGQETNLVKLIKSAYEGRTIDFDRKHTFEIALSFDPENPENPEATVTIDGWEVNKEGHEF